MPKVEVSTIVRRKDRQSVYDLLKNMQEFPRFMRDVKSLKISEKQGNRFVSCWNAEVDGAAICWTEEDLFNDKDMSLKFKMLEGDYTNYAGEWVLHETPHGTKITINANFDWGIPAFEKFVGNILVRKARKSLKGMLNAIKNKLEGKAKK
ncbi:MAG: SRPBCC family protein [Candidatus Omnitrophica bacterium]|nr:SRPBCC family protein [Candidatus Omnitrophota bacterium]